MPTTLELRGLAELRTALRNLPEDLTHEASAIVLGQAEDAQRRITGVYPEGPTGNLKHGVTVERNASKFTAGAIVRSRAKHAHLYEFGTGRRTTRTNSSRGSMPRARTDAAMLPIVIRARARMFRALVDLVRRAGFEVAD